MFVNTNRLLTITSCDDIFFTHILVSPESVEANPRTRVNDTEQIAKSGRCRSWFSILKDEKEHLVYVIGGQSSRTNLNVV